MFNVMIVEDSKPIVRNIKRKIEEADSRLQVTHVAYNGAEALSILEREHIDIVFTDIRMPKMDGLTFVQEAKQRQSSAHFFILSGFDDFQYARRAIQLEVCEYLLKPLDSAELTPALTRTIEQLLVARRETMELQTKRMLNSIHSIDDQVQPFQAQYYQVAIVRNGYFQSGEQAVDRKQLYDYCHTYLPCSSCVIADTPASSEIAILIGSEENNDDFSTSIEALYDKLRESYPIVQVALSTIETDYERLKSHYLRLTSQLNQQVRLGTQLILPHMKTAAAEMAEHNTIEEILKIKIQSHIRHARLDALKLELSQLIQHWEQHSTPVNHIQMILHKLNDLTGEQLDDDSEPIESILLQCLSYSALKARCIERFTALAQRVGAHSNPKIELLEMVEAFCKANLHRQINMQELSRQLNYSSTYIIRIVKEAQGMTPIEYFNHLKIEEASRLISDNDSLLIKDVADRLGFSDQHYFCKVFKQFTGYSPSEYRKRTLV